MTEIGKNNINQYSFGVKKIAKDQNPEQKTNGNNKAEDAEKASYTQDTGVLGRSQITSSNEEGIKASVDKAVKLATDKPEILLGSEGMFDSIYNSLLESGVEESEAYMRALFAEEEFFRLASSRR